MLFYSLFFDCFQCDICLCPLHDLELLYVVIHPETVLVVPCLLSLKQSGVLLSKSESEGIVDHVFNRGSNFERITLLSFSFQIFRPLDLGGLATTTMIEWPALIDVAPFLHDRL